MNPRDALTHLLSSTPNEAPYQIREWSRSIAAIDESNTGRTGRLGYVRKDEAVEIDSSGVDSWECRSFDPNAPRESVTVHGDDLSYDEAIAQLAHLLFDTDEGEQYSEARTITTPH